MAALRSALPSPPAQERQVAELRKIGGTVFERAGTVLEVNLNQTDVKDEDLDLLSGFTKMTDLSLEETAIGDDSLRRCSGFESLVWLNLYRTRVGDDGLTHLRGLKRLEQLPLGETRVTDAGLVHLVGLRRLTYLGLKGDRISDAGMKHVAKLTRLTGLNLAGTDIGSDPEATAAPILAVLRRRGRAGPHLCCHAHGSSRRDPMVSYNSSVTIALRGMFARGPPASYRPSRSGNATTITHLADPGREGNQAGAQP